MTVWIACKEKMPVRDVKVLIYVTGGAGVQVAMFKGHVWRTDGLLSLDRVTHWARLPEIPESRHA